MSRYQVWVGEDQEVTLAETYSVDEAFKIWDVILAVSRVPSGVRPIEELGAVPQEPIGYDDEDTWISNKGTEVTRPGRG
jgi:hypothetical protein